MIEYNELLRRVLRDGQREPNRTGIDTITVPGEMLKLDIRKGFPAVTGKKLAFKSVVGELIGFLRGVTSAADFRALGCNVWNQNANENEAWLANPYRKGVDDLGPVYGAQWRKWEGSSTLIEVDPSKGIKGNMTLCTPYHDQLAQALHDVRHNSQSRRILVLAFNPAVMDRIALPACHVMFQLLPRSDGTLHMCMYMRSADIFLGVPFNIASYAVLLELFAKWTGRVAATLTMFLADAHIYVNHLNQVEEQLSRTPYQLPTLDLNEVMPIDPLGMDIDQLVDFLSTDKIKLVNYQHHPAIKAPMAV